MIHTLEIAIVYMISSFFRDLWEKDLGRLNSPRTGGQEGLRPFVIPRHDSFEVKQNIGIEN